MKRNVIEFTRATDTPDADFSHLRGEAVLDKLLRRYPDQDRALRRAHDRLRDEPGYAAAMHRVAFSLQEGRIRLFISYRVGVDADAARAVAEVFRVLSLGRVQVTFADEFTARISGQDYKREIEQATRSAHWFLILLSDASELSSWCMYETGLFRAGTTSGRLERLICLHHPAARLHSAIDGFQSVAGEVARIQAFLDGLFRQPDPLPGWPALNPQLDDATLAEAAARIAQALRPPRRPVFFNPTVTLLLPQGAAPDGLPALAACTVLTDRLTARLFGKAEPPATWGALVAGLPASAAAPIASATGAPAPAGQPVADWQHELLAVLRKAAAGDLVRPLVHSFESAQRGQQLRPVLQAMESDPAGGALRVEIAFLEDFGSPAGAGLPGRTQALLTAIRLHHRVRWELLERLGDGADVQAEPELAAVGAKALSRITRDASSHGGLDTPALRAAFHGRDADTLDDLLEDWQALCHPASGRLVQALRAEPPDAAAVRRALASCRALNRQFLELLLPALDATPGG